MLTNSTMLSFQVDAGRFTLPEDPTNIYLLVVKSYSGCRALVVSATLKVLLKTPSLRAANSVTRMNATPG
jgi:hypothetical protein